MKYVQNSKTDYAVLNVFTDFKNIWKAPHLQIQLALSKRYKLYAYIICSRWYSCSNPVSKLLRLECSTLRIDQTMFISLLSQWFCWFSYSQKKRYMRVCLGLVQNFHSAVSKPFVSLFPISVLTFGCIKLVPKCFLLLFSYWQNASLKNVLCGSRTMTINLQSHLKFFLWNSLLFILAGSQIYWYMLTAYSK